MITMHQLIDKYITLCREIFGSMAQLSNNSDKEFEQLIKKCFNIEFKQYEPILDCFYLFEDTQEANLNYHKYELEGPTKDSSTGERYLRLYGLMNSCYLQMEALIKCSEELNIANHSNNSHKLKYLEIFDFRHCFASHSPNRKNRSYVLCRNSLRNNIVAGYSLKSDKEERIIFKKASIAWLLHNWESNLLVGIKTITEHLITNMSNYTAINDIYVRFNIKLQQINEQYKNSNVHYIKCDNDILIKITGINKAT